MLHITSPELICFISLYLLTTFTQFPYLHPQPPATTNWISYYEIFLDTTSVLSYSICLSISDFTSVQSVMSDSLWPHESQHARPPYPSPTPRVYSNSCPLSQWCHPAISSSVVPFSSCLQSLPASGSFPISQLFTWGGQSIRVSASASVLAMNTQDWSPCSPRDSQESSPTPQFKSINSSVLSFLHSPTLTSIQHHWKNHSLDQMDLCWESNVSAF